MMYVHMTFSLHSTHSTYLFKIFFSLLTLSTAFLQKTSGPGKNKDNRSLSFHFDLFSGYWFVGFSGFSLISHKLLDKTYIYAHQQNGLNEEIKIMCFICRFNVYFLRNQRKCSQNGEEENFKF